MPSELKISMGLYPETYKIETLSVGAFFCLPADQRTLYKITAIDRDTVYYETGDGRTVGVPVGTDIVPVLHITQIQCIKDEV